jgi:hypothetical protein
MRISAISGIQISKMFPKRNYGRLCPWKFGGTECNTSNKAPITSGSSLYRVGTAVRGGNPGNQTAGVTSFYDTALQNSSASAWVYGRVSLLVGGTTEERNVIDFEVDVGTGGTVTFDVPCATTIGASTKYELIMGCPKTWVACSGASAWGPYSNNNQLNYGGFLHVSKRPDRWGYPTYKR